MTEILSLLLSFVGALIGSFLTIKLGYRELYAKNVTQNRMDWINVWRNQIPEFLSKVDCILISKKNLKININLDNCNYNSDSELMEKLYRSKYLIEIRLNLNESKHQMVYVLMKDIVENIVNYKNDLNFNLIKDKEEQLLVLSRLILKEEWERVKTELK